MEQALNEEQQMRRESFVHEQNIHGMSSDWFYCQAMKSPKHGSIDIALIGSASFEWHMRNKKTEVFVTSLYKIDWTIEDKWLEEWQAEEIAEQELIQQWLPQ